MSLLFVSGAGAMLWLMPGSLRPLDYMVAGSFATALGRVAAFWLIARPSR